MYSGSTSKGLDDGLRGSEFIGTPGRHVEPMALSPSLGFLLAYRSFVFKCYRQARWSSWPPRKYAIPPVPNKVGDHNGVEWPPMCLDSCHGQMNWRSAFLTSLKAGEPARFGEVELSFPLILFGLHAEIQGSCMEASQCISSS